jgi:hypothetical protein
MNVFSNQGDRVATAFSIDGIQKRFYSSMKMLPYTSFDKDTQEVILTNPFLPNPMRIPVKEHTEWVVIENDQVKVMDNDEFTRSWKFKQEVYEAEF